jgi:hypothetical protein
MEKEKLRRLLTAVKRGVMDVDGALDALRFLPFEDLGFAKVDHHRYLRRGLPEVVFGEGKTPRQILGIARTLIDRGGPLLVTRISGEASRALKKAYPRIRFHPPARMATWTPPDWHPPRRTGVVVVAAGTSDIPVAEEAAVTAEMMGNGVERIYDVGVAGLHRLLAHGGRLLAARVLVVVAGMEGALPSVVAGMVDAPVVAVPTSIGYGASFGGISALLSMLNSCAGGVMVVNIDNGFGAGFAASLINRDGVAGRGTGRQPGGRGKPSKVSGRRTVSRPRR